MLLQCIPEMPTGIKLIHQLGMGPTQEAIGSWYIPTFPKRQMSVSGGDHRMPTEPSCSLTIVLLFSVPPIHVCIYIPENTLLLADQYIVVYFYIASFPGHPLHPGMRLLTVYSNSLHNQEIDSIWRYVIKS